MSGPGGVCRGEKIVSREGLKVSMYLLGVWRRASMGPGGLEVSEWDWWGLVESGRGQ